MRKLTVVFILLCSVIAAKAQSDFSRLPGTWELQKHVLYEGGECGPSNKMTITFYKGGTYKMLSNGYPITGRWKIEANQINYYDSILPDPKDGTVADHKYVFRFSEKGELVQEDYICSEVGGTSYYSKK